MLDTGTGPIAFVVVYAIWGLKTAAIVAIALGVVMAIERIARKKTVVNVLGGLFVTVISAVIAWRTGKAETYFVPRALIQAGYAIVFAGSAVASSVRLNHPNQFASSSSPRTCTSAKPARRVCASRSPGTNACTSTTASSACSCSSEAPS
jgi:hypothetical protein